MGNKKGDQEATTRLWATQHRSLLVVGEDVSSEQRGSRFFGIGFSRILWIEYDDTP